jgi:hypothetical protein
MKKRIIIIAITVLTLALLSGCDAILEGFFPEFADTNSIDVHVKITTIVNVYEKPVIVALIPFDGSNNPIKGEIVKEERNEFDFYVSFDGLPNGKYQVYVWYDAVLIDGYITNEWNQANVPKDHAYYNGIPGNIDVIFDFDNDFYSVFCDLTSIWDDPTPPVIKTALSP